MATVYAVLLNEPDATAWKLLEKQWPSPDHYKLSDTVAFIRDRQGRSPKQVGIAVGMLMAADLASASHYVRGFVFPLDAPMWGLNDSALWSWLNDGSDE